MPLGEVDTETRLCKRCSERNTVKGGRRILAVCAALQGMYQKRVIHMDLKQHD